MAMRAGAVSPGRVERAESAVESYQRVEQEILALPAAAVGRVTADVVLASSIALGAVSNLEKLRPELEQLSDGGSALRALNHLEDYALAAFYAHLQVVPDSSQKEVVALLERARPLRENLLKVAEALVGFDILPDSSVRAIREGTGNIDVAKDVVALAALFSSNWPRVENHVPFAPELLAEAAAIGPKLLRAIGSKEVGDVRKDPSFEWPSLRERAFRLLVNAYEELRRAVTYLRWAEGDAKSFAPSLHQRATSKGKGKPASSDAGEPPDAEQPEPEPLLSDAALLGAVPPRVASGLPGAHPFSE